MSELEFELYMALQGLIQLLDRIGGFLTPEDQSALRYARQIVVRARAGVPAEAEVVEAHGDGVAHDPVVRPDL